MNNQTTNNQTKATIRHLTELDTPKKAPLTADQLAKIMEFIHKLEKPQTDKQTEKQTTEQVDHYANRNAHLKTSDRKQFDTALINNIAIKATWNTLKYLVNQNATVTATTDDIQAKRDEKTPLGYNMALQLLKDLPHDLTILNTHNTEKAFCNTIDIYQTACVAVIPFVLSDTELTENTIVHTKQLKNGSEKDYTLYRLACNAIRQYIQAQAQKQYKKKGYLIGYTDEGKPVYTTKKPKDDLTDIDEHNRTAILDRYNLTAREQEIIKLYVDGLGVAEIAEKVGMTFEGTKKALYRAKQTIKATATEKHLYKTK